MEDLIKAAQALITYIEWGGVFDTLDDDGEGRVDTSQSHDLQQRVKALEASIQAAIPIVEATNLVKKCLIESIQTAIQTTRQ